MTRAEKAGQEMGKAIIEMVHLMYQNNTAGNFYLGLTKEIQREASFRGPDREIGAPR